MNSKLQSILVAAALLGIFLWYAFTNSPASVFFFGLTILVLFMWYFASEVERRKHIAGALLTVMITALCVQALWPKKMNKTAERLKYEPLAAETVTKLSEAVTNALTKNGFAVDATDTRTVFPYKKEGSYTKKTAFLKMYEHGKLRAYLLEGPIAGAAGAESQFVNVFKFWEAAEPKDKRTKVKPAPAEIKFMWSEVAAAAAPFDNTKGKIPLPLGIDLEGGSDYQVKIKPVEGNEIMMDEADSVSKTLDKRLNEFGGKDLLISKLGVASLRVQMPGIDEEQRDAIHDAITKPSVLNLYIVDNEAQRNVGEILSNAKIVPGKKLFKAKSPNDGVQGHYLLSSGKPDLEGTLVSRSWANVDPGNRWTVSLDFNSKGQDIFAELTEKNVGKQMAIVLDGVVLSAPVIKQMIVGTTEISGDFTEEESRGLSASLNNPLRNPLIIEAENSVDPALGKAAISQGVIACVAGMALTMLFMLLYYRVGGFVAILGLVINLLILLGAMALFQFTLTLPGIAGIVLTIGMAVDANVLIYERFREERAAGKSMEGALHAAYDKAFSAIFDSNITTLITAALLYFVASGPIKGFAVTLTVGIIGTMFQALIVSRILLTWLINARWIKNMKFASLIPVTFHDFLSQRKFAYLFTTIISLALPLGLAIHREKSFGIDFRGGHMLTLKVSDPSITPDRVQEVLGKLALSEPAVVQSLKPVGSNDKFISIRMIAKSDEAEAGKQVDETKKLLTQELKLPDNLEISNSTVGPSVGKYLLKESLMALALGLLGIFIYLGVRFEFSFSVGAIIALAHDVLIIIGLCIITGREINLVLVGAFLTIAGYSVNDTIVIFDRIREGVRTKTGDMEYIMNASISETLPRTVLTGGTTLLSMITLYLFGGEVMRDFAFSMFFGTLIGTYSSIFVAAPIALWWARRRGSSLQKEILDADERRRLIEEDPTLGPKSLRQ